MHLITYLTYQFSDDYDLKNCLLEKLCPINLELLKLGALQVCTNVFFFSFQPCGVLVV